MKYLNTVLCALLTISAAMQLAAMSTEAKNAEKSPKACPETERVQADLLLSSAIVNRFNDIEVTISDISDRSKLNVQLAYSVSYWQKQGHKAIWLSLSIKHAEYVSYLMSQNFRLHHATAEKFVFTHWLQTTTESILPSLLPSHIAIAALVIDDEKNVLAVRELYADEFGYRLPGGGVDARELLPQAAQREVKEETGIDTEFQAIIGFTHGQFPFAMEIVSKAYFCCLLRPLNKTIIKQEKEIADARWIPYEEFKRNAKGIFAHFIEAYETGTRYYIFKEDAKRGTLLFSGKLMK